MEVVTTLELDKSELSCMCFLDKSCLVATGQEDGSIRLWNLEINSWVQLVSQKGFKHTNSISCIISETTPDGEYLIAGSYDGQISIWEIAQKEQGGKDGQNVSTTIYPQFSHSIDNMKFIKLDGMESYEILCLYYLRDDLDQNYILVGGNFNKINVYKLKGNTFDYFCTLEGHKNSVTCFANDGNMLFSGSDDQTIIAWNTVEWHASFMHDKIRIIRPHKILRKHTESIQALCMLKNNGILLSCAYDHMIHAWQYQTGKILESFQKKNEELRCMDFIDEQLIDPNDYDDEDFEMSGEFDSASQLKRGKNTNQSKLYVGTNQNGLIITIDISNLLAMENNIDENEM